MDPISMALSNAMLEAVARVQAHPTAALSTGPAKTLTDAIERALRDADPQGTAVNGAGATINRLV